MNGLFKYISGFVIVIIAIALQAHVPKKNEGAIDALPCVALRSGDVKWLSFEEAQKLSQKHPKKIFIDVYTDWCGWCKKMDKTTLKDPLITSYLDKRFYSVKLNAESSKKIIYKGKEITESELATKVFKASGYPTTVYLDEKQNLLQPISSYLEVEMLDKILHYYGEDFYKNSTWDAFDAVYSSSPN